MTLPEHNGIDESIQKEQEKFLEQLGQELQERKKAKAEAR
jgi:hypothetical protein